MELTIGTIAIPALIIGITEAAKKFGVTGKASQGLAMTLGVLLAGLAYGITEGLIPEPYTAYIIWGVTALTSPFTAMGYYDLAKRLTNNKAK